MELADCIRLGGQAPGLRFLLIGGYAVAAHGHTRATFDVDFLAREADRDAWLVRVAAAGLRLFAQTAAFAQFTLGESGEGLDLMFVADATFEGMWLSSEVRDFGGCQARVPCLDHLLALKLHALRQPLVPDLSKHVADVESLARRNQLDLREPRYERLFVKYGSRELYDTFLRLLRNP